MTETSANNDPAATVGAGGQAIIDPMMAPTAQGAAAAMAAPAQAPPRTGRRATSAGRPGSAGPVDPFDPVDPFRPGDFTYDPDEWERLPRRTKPWIRMAIIVAVVILGAAFAYNRVNSWIDAQINPAGLPGESVVVEIPSGASDSDVMRILAESGVIPNSTVAQYWIRFNEVGDFQAGEYMFRANSSLEDATGVLAAGPLPPVFQRLTLPEGLWSGDMRNVMLDNLDQLDPGELDQAMNSGAIRSQFQPRNVSTLEGLMFPATYQIGEEDAANELAMVQRLVNQMDTVLIELGADDGLMLDNGRELSPYELIVVASMIEEEARVDEDRAKIARVIYNRLIDGEILGIDATTIYGVHLRRCDEDPNCANPSTEFAWYDAELFQSQLDDTTDPYNTRAVAGLPPTPISSPGRASLSAALNPEPGTWRYYVLADTEGRHFFTDDYNEFLRKVEEGRANGLF